LKGSIGFMVFILTNVLFCIVISVKRKKFSQKIDFIAIFLSAIGTTILFHIIAVIDDIKSSQWIVISIPIAFIFGLLISGLTSIILQGYFMQKKK
jgi:hypothetical protein